MRNFRSLAFAGSVALSVIVLALFAAGFFDRASTSPVQIHPQMIAQDDSGSGGGGGDQSGNGDPDTPDQIQPSEQQEEQAEGTSTGGDTGGGDGGPHRLHLL